MSTFFQDVAKSNCTKVIWWTWHLWALQVFLDLQSTAEESIRHIGSAAEVSGHFVSIPLLPKCLAAELSYCRSVRTPHVTWWTHNAFVQWNAICASNAFIIPKIFIGYDFYVIANRKSCGNGLISLTVDMSHLCTLCAPKHAVYKCAMSRVISSFFLHLFPISPSWICMLMQLAGCPVFYSNNRNSELCE